MAKRKNQKNRLGSFIIISVLSGLFLFSGLLAGSARGLTSNVPVSLDVPNTTVTANGFAAPDALVKLMRNGTVIASGTADANGNYSITVNSPSGIQSFSVNYSDVRFVSSSTYSESINIVVQQNTNFTAFLSPTLQLLGEQTVQDDSIMQFRGYSMPNAAVELDIDFGLFTFQTTADSDGMYEFIIRADEVGSGAHTAVTRSTFAAQTSDSSLSVQFEVVSEDSPTTPDIVVSPDSLPPPTPLAPEDGAVIEGDTVIITGDSVPNAQINVYANNRIVGSTQADESGRWQFTYKATSTPITLTFEACLDGRCSVFSKTISLSFSKLSPCKTFFELEQYRFWGVNVGDTIELNAFNISESGVFLIDWGDGTTEQFDIDSGMQDLAKSYDSSGVYNGSIRLVSASNDECSYERFFSVSVEDSRASNTAQFMWIAFIIFGLIIAAEMARRDRNNS